jgi:hypothetical protein
MIDEGNSFLLIPRVSTPIFSQLTRAVSENPVEAKSKFPDWGIKSTLAQG